MIEKVKPLLIALGVIKRIALQPVYFQVIPLFFGFYQIVKNQNILRLFISLFLMILLNILTSWTNHAPAIVIARNVQLALLLLFSHYCYFRLSDDILKKVLLWVLLLSILIFGIDIQFSEPNLRRFWLKIPQYFYIVGEPTLSSFVYLVAILIATLKRWYVFIPFFLLLGVLTYCRGFVLSVTFFYFLLLIRFYVPKIAHFLSLSLLASFYLYPFLAKYIHYLSSPENLNFLYRLSTKRTGIHASYMQNVDLFGAGYFNAQSYFAKLEVSLLPFLKTTALVDSFTLHDPHNLFIQTIVEFGIIGYALFGIFLYRFMKSISSSHFAVRESIVALFSFTLLLGVYNEVFLWLFIGWICRSYSSDRETFNFLLLFKKMKRSLIDITVRLFNVIRR